jgi:tetratricopeptide (TPR) repeat protein
MILITVGIMLIGLIFFVFLVVMPAARQAREISDHDTFQENIEALRHDPQDAMAHRQLGYHYSARRDYQKSELHWREAARIEPANREAKFWLANALQRQGKNREALQLYQRVISEDQTDDYGRLATKIMGKMQRKVNGGPAEKDVSGKSEQQGYQDRNALQRESR